MAALAGDPENITVIGQSAGAHLSSLVMLRKATEEFEYLLRGDTDAQNGTDSRDIECIEEGPREKRLAHTVDRPKWSTRQIRHLIGVGGPYDLASYVG